METKVMDGKTLTRASFLAKCYEVGVRRIQQLSEEGIITPWPGGKDKGGYWYDLAKSILAIGRYYQKKADSRQSIGSDDLNEEKLKQITAKRMLEEIKVQRIRGELHHAEDIKRIIGSMFSRIHGGLESFPLGIAPLLVGKTDAVKIAEKIRERLSKILYEITAFDFEAFKNMNADYILQLSAKEETQSGEDDGNPD